MSRLVLSLTAILLSALLAYQWSDWSEKPTSEGLPLASGPDSGSAQDPRDDLLERLEPMEDREAYASVIDRPLFRPQRKPPEEEPDEVAPTAEAPEARDLAGFDLSAVVITPGVVSAWVRDPSAQDLKRLRLGDELAGWSVKDILSDRLVMERQGERDELLLRDFSQMPPPVAQPQRARPTPVAQRTPPRAIPRPPQRANNPPTSGQAPGVVPK
jgi:general secretion pathway protein N